MFLAHALFAIAGLIRQRTADLVLRFSCLVLSLALALSLPCNAQGKKIQNGVALIIGQSSYTHLTPLPNPASDARMMDETLRALGFETTVVTDLTSRKLNRAISNFIEDSEGADVAVIYYSGHGIEASGENWLIPVDADISSLNEADRKLAGLSALIDQLNATVPLAIAFLDACRSNPFPPGSMLTSSDGKTSAVSDAGLGGTRGVSAMTEEPGHSGANTLVGFAAEPGQAALDGPAGGSSPYAAALSRHLSAMDGSEIGVVMRLVTQEVYLKTMGRQRPWVNETLTQLIYLGSSQPPQDGNTSRILTERRQLLLTIADLPAGQREQVETAANTAGVPMDALYGLLRSLGTAIPSDPDELQKVLTSEAARVKELLAAQRALDSEDPEILHLAKLAGDALQDGALDAYLSFWEQAKARFLAASANLDETEVKLRARRLEGGEVLASTAAAFELKAEYRTAADNYALAFAQVAKWDRDKAWEFKRREADAWLSEGDEKGDKPALMKAIATFEEALILVPRATAPGQWAWTMNNLGNALLVTGGRAAGSENIHRAIAAYRSALEERPRQTVPLLWAKTQNNLAIAYSDLAERTGDATLYDLAIAAYRGALAETPREADPMLWATMMSNLGDALTNKGGESLEEAVVVHRAALAERLRQRVPLLWAASQENLGNALTSLGKARASAQLISEGVAAYRVATEVVTRNKLPLRWAGLQYNLGNAYSYLDRVEDNANHLAEAVRYYREALIEESYERSPQSWAKTQYMLGQSLWLLGERHSDSKLLQQAIDATRSSLRFYTLENNPADWAITSYFLGSRLHRFGSLTQDTRALAEAVGMLKQSLSYYTRERNAIDWADTESTYAEALADWAFAEGNAEQLKSAIAAYRSVLEVYTRKDLPVEWASVQVRAGSAYYYLAILQNSAQPAQEGRVIVAAAIEVFAAENKPQSAAAAKAILATIDKFISELPR